MNTGQVNRVKMVKGVKVHLFQHFHLIHPAKGMLFFSSSVTSFFTDALMSRKSLVISRMDYLPKVSKRSLLTFTSD